MLALAALAACGSEQPSAPTPPSPPPPSPAAAPVEEEAATVPAPGTSGQIYSEMVVQDFRGGPIANMMPIATERPNAFDEPLVRGAMTDERGWSAFTLPAGRRLFLRAWDPQMRMFANNFYEMPPVQGSRTPQAVITMVPAGSLELTCVGPDGPAAAGASAKLMLVHPKYGEWWPARGMTDDHGYIRFSPVPPGEYLLRLNVEGVGVAQFPTTFIKPGEPTDLGAVALRPETTPRGTSDGD